MMQINNAGSNAYSYKPLMEASDEDLMLVHIIIFLNDLPSLSIYIFAFCFVCSEVVSTNTLGLMICCREVKSISTYPTTMHVEGF